MTYTVEDILAAARQVQREQRDDPVFVIHLYVDKGWGITRIARHVGLHRSTVYRRLEAAGVYRGPGKSGPPRQEECQRGHDMAEWGRPITGSTGRFCRLCKRERDRESWRRRLGKGNWEN